MSALDQLVKMDLPSDEEILKTLQYLAVIKIGKYEAKWSKSSEDHIARLQKDFNNVTALINYFTKR